MEISFKEILLRRICATDLELLRKWRNSRLVAENMFFQEEISRTMQADWFASLHPENDFYFIIIYKELAIGLINLKDIDWQQKQGEAGLYIALEKYRNTPLAIYASLALLHFSFEDKKLETISAKVKKDNLNTIQYNKSLGFEKIAEEEYVLSKARYFAFTKSIYNKLK